MATEPAGDETFWRWSIIVAGAIIVAGLSAILFVGKSSAQNTSASATTSTLPNGLHVVVGSATPVPTTPNTTPTKIKIPVLPLGNALKLPKVSALPTFVKLPFTFGTPGATVSSPTKSPTTTTTTTVPPTTTTTVPPTTTTTTTTTLPVTTTT